ncbi:MULTISPECIES: lanthionine synthetase C family protein [Pseudoalteromonas]|uniref:Lantibiotic biosynthesis protein n=1 Tax=Pseudoalteromonas amylolytica TaxID=1859457 RepID=A0A1S1N4L8_9GAMM|nr:MULTISPECIES: lanthionine synthetase C family protein [Pseudoalteromonas]OHU91862.1 lantibiotic biosynthesis protein [Pseudoalteromonas sp. JW3]OHU93188.1 lantibiotic biosynthesis protein [Pseudoalteromonas amylolytica]
MRNNNTMPLEKKQKLESIIHLLARLVSAKDESHHGILSGLAGHLLFLYKAHEYNSDWVDEALFTQKLDKLQDELEEQTLELSTGLAGQAWLLEYLNQANQEDYAVDLLEDVDALFTGALDHNPWLGEIEYVLGLAGYAPYAARRLRYSDQQALYSTIVKGFESTASRLDNGLITWSQPSQSVYRLDKECLDQPEYNLGFAHGVPGIIAALLPALKISTLKPQVTELVQGACDWLLTQRKDDKDSVSCFSSCASHPHETSRLGWCYGDLTIALVLARAGQALESPSYVDQALKVALKNIPRDASTGFVKDAGLCHGYVGIMTIYQALNELMPHPQLEEVVTTWLDYTLEQFEQQGLEAFYFFSGESKNYVEDFSLLTGYSGIGLCLLSVLNDDLSWLDSMLMA